MVFPVYCPALLPITYTLYTVYYQLLVLLIHYGPYSSYKLVIM